jgi:hypothetical protein
MVDMPELAVAEGSVDAQPLTDPTAPPAAPVPVRLGPAPTGPPATSPPPDTDSRPRRRRAVLAAGAATLFLGAAATWRFVDATSTTGGARRTSLMVGPTLTGHTDRIRAVAFSGDSRFLASTGDDRAIRIWNPLTGEPVGTFGNDTANTGLTEIAIDDTGTRVAVRYQGPRGEGIQVWDVATRTMMTFLTDAVPMTSMAFIPDTDGLVSAHLDGQLRLRDVEDGGAGLTLDTGVDHAGRLELGRDRRSMVVGLSHDRDPPHVVVQLWDLPTQKMTRTIDGYRDAGISGDGTMLALTTIEGALHRCDLATGAITPLTTDRLGDSARFVSDALIVRTMQANRGRPQLWNPVDRRMTDEIPGDGPVAVRPDAGQIAALTPDRTAIRLWTPAE